MTILVALILGIVEGLTEYLPVSSTGHLILVGHFLGGDSEADKSFEIVIQLGAILAVLVYYRSLLWQRARELPSGKPEATRLLLALVAGFVPTAALGLVARKAIKAHLFGARPVAHRARRRRRHHDRGRARARAQAGRRREPARGGDAAARLPRRRRAVRVADSGHVALDGHHRDRAAHRADDGDRGRVLVPAGAADPGRGDDLRGVQVAPRSGDARRGAGRGRHGDLVPRGLGR